MAKELWGSQEAGGSREPWAGLGVGDGYPLHSHCRDWVQKYPLGTENRPLPGLAESVFTQWAAGAAGGR